MKLSPRTQEIVLKTVIAVIGWTVSMLIVWNVYIWGKVNENRDILISARCLHSATFDFCATLSIILNKMEDLKARIEKLERIHDDEASDFRRKRTLSPSALKSALMEWQFKHFKPEELLSPDGLKQLAQNIMPLRSEAVQDLEVFRVFINRPILVNHGHLGLRGYRSPKENDSIYGDNRPSFHIAGCAFDISCPGMDTEELYKWANSFGWKGIGKYSTFVHVDMRSGDQARWDGIAR